MKQIAATFWITNISDRNVTLSDLNISVKAKSSVNLLDSKHYSFTLEELEKSVASGSIFKKRDKIFKRVIPPPEATPILLQVDINAAIPSKPRSIFEIKHERYAELEISDEAYAAQTGDLDE